MFPTQESENKPINNNEPTLSEPTLGSELTFESIEQFAAWLDADLDQLVSSFEDFETDKSVRKFFTRN